MFGILLGTKKVTSPESSRYATSGDFCRIFSKEMNRLYLLSFLMTGDRAMAERCFVRGLDDSVKGNPVFKEWAESWARRTIIQNAIQMIWRRPADSSVPSSAPDQSGGATASESVEILQVVELPVFERFVFVMSVLERYSDQECSLLLGCSRAEVIAARTRALELLGRSAEVRRRLSIASDRQVLRDELGTGVQLEALSGLATSA